MINVAHELFLEQGYAATPLRQVAERAGVALPTLYAAFGNKRALLFAVFEAARHEAAINEPGVEVPLERQRPLTAERIAHRVRLTREGGAPVARIIDKAGAADPEVAELWLALQHDRHERMSALARALHRQRLLRPGLTVSEAADVLWTITSNETYGLLVLDRGWSPGQYERWLAETLAGTVIA
jgi:AcrR family transcriptional regulator